MAKPATLFRLGNIFRPNANLPTVKIPYGSYGLIIEVATDRTDKALETARRIKLALKTGGPADAESIILQEIMAADRAKVPMHCAIRAPAAQL